MTNLIKRLSLAALLLAVCVCADAQKSRKPQKRGKYEFSFDLPCYVEQLKKN